MKDQFNREVPNDLVVIDFGFEPGELVNFTREPEEVQTIFKADWYELDVDYLGSIVLASAEQINYLCETDPLDCGFPDNWKELPINHISPVLHRWTPEDGFYHA